ncbi:phage protein NinX family protein [Pseudomonas asiatica]|uniref:phage protein NinX family protein n=1 Tax=Pseudomonas asiatica TaxID=2219225 RepID=UPI00383B54E1
MTDLIEVRVSNLIGAPLDWAVAKAEEVPVFIDHQGWVRKLPDDTNAWRPSWNWCQGGPLIDKYQGSANHSTHLAGSEFSYSAGPGGETSAASYAWCSGPTALIAFCRSLVNAKIGSVVLVPKELMP